MKTKTVEIIPFVQVGKKEVIRFIAAPQLFETEDEAIKALATAVRDYQSKCGKGYNTYYSDNPFTAIIIHGINA